MKTLFRITILASLVFSGYAFGQSTAPAAAAPAEAAAGQPATVPHPYLNGLEKGEYKRRQMMATMSAARTASDEKAVTNAQAKVAAAQNGKIRAAAQTRLDQANKRLTMDNKASTNAQARVTGWNSDVLKSHHGDPARHKIDWQKGQVTNQ